MYKYYKGHLSGKDVLGDRQFFMKKMDESELWKEVCIEKGKLDRPLHSLKISTSSH